MNTAGFYKKDNNDLLYGPNFVESGSYSLYRTDKDNYVYPIGGWYWFDNEDDAYKFFEMEKPPKDNLLPFFPPPPQL